MVWWLQYVQLGSTCLVGTNRIKSWKSVSQCNDKYNWHIRTWEMERNDLAFFFFFLQYVSPVIDYDTRQKENLQKKLVVFMKNRVCFWSSSFVLSAFCSVYLCTFLFYFIYVNCLPYFPLPPTLPRFADSIRGMLKVILVLMLAGASLSSTWFTLTCLSRVTHLPSTAGGDK